MCYTEVFRNGVMSFQLQMVVKWIRILWVCQVNTAYCIFATTVTKDKFQVYKIWYSGCWTSFVSSWLVNFNAWQQSGYRLDSQLGACVGYLSLSKIRSTAE